MFDLDSAIETLLQRLRVIPMRRRAAVDHDRFRLWTSRMSFFVRAALLVVLVLAPAAHAQNATPGATAGPGQPASQGELPNAAARATDARPAQAAPDRSPDAQSIMPSSARVPRELSPWSMFMSADALVKAVMLSLAFA